MNELQATRITRLLVTIKEQIDLMEKTKKITEDDIAMLNRLLGAVQEHFYLLRPTTKVSKVRL